MKCKLLSVVAALAISGCASPQTTMPETAGGAKPEIHIGMTKEDVLKALGHKPKTIQTGPSGEVWHYDNVELAMIPFNFGFRPEFKNYTFNSAGVLIDFSTVQPTK
jgi:hypothetical protein